MNSTVLALRAQAIREFPTLKEIPVYHSRDFDEVRISSETVPVFSQNCQNLLWEDSRPCSEEIRNLSL